MSYKKAGFSLLELVVALGILAAVTTVALRSTTGLQNQTRYQQSTRSLDEIRSAIVGAPNLRQPDGSVQVTGFVADVGRAPKFLISNFDPLFDNPIGSHPPLGLNPGDPLNELLELPAGITPFAFVNSTVDPEIQIGSGWQGPYIRLGSGPKYIRDGWGHSFRVYLGATQKGTSGDSFDAIKSWGADNTAGGIDGYNKDVSITIPANVLGGSVTQYNGRVRMYIGQNPDNDPLQTSSGTSVSLWVAYFGPDGTGGVGVVAQKIADGTSPVTWAATGTTNSFRFSLTGSSGPRVLRAYALPSGVLTFDAAAVISALWKSAPINVVGVGGGQQVSNLILPNYVP